MMLYSCTDKKNHQYEHAERQELRGLLNDISIDSIESNVRTLADFHTRHTSSDTSSDTLGIGAARRWIFSKFDEYRKASDNRLQVSYDRYTETKNKNIDQPTDIVNIVGVLPGTQLESKERMYVVSGHYDSRVSGIMDDSTYAPGANDNASGTAAVMELARVMSKYKFDATIVFMAVAGEEQGRLGAIHYAKEARQQNLDIAAMFNNDMIGKSRKNSDGSIDNVVQVFAQGIPAVDTLSQLQKMMRYNAGEHDTPSHQLGRFVHRIAKEHLPDLRVNIMYRKGCYLQSGDHLAFLSQNYPALRFSEAHGLYEREHQGVRKEKGMQYGDLPKFIDHSYLTKVTRLNAASLFTLANAPARPREMIMDASKPENSSMLRWKANDEPDLKGYEVVWRARNNSSWEHSKFVGDTTRYTVQGVAAENHLFGLRSVDQYGYKSPVVYPLPAQEK